MSTEMLTWLSIVIGVIIALAGFFMVKNRNRQVQKVDRGGRGYQSGGDMNIHDKQ